MPVYSVFAKSKVQPHDRNIGVTDTWNSACYTGDVHPVHYTKENYQSSIPETKVPMSVEHGLLEETLTG